MWTIVILGRPQDIFDFLIPFHLGDISAGLAAIAFFLSTQNVKKNPLSIPEFRLFLVFFGIALLCTPFGYYPRKSLLFIWNFFIKSGIYFYLFVNLVSDKRRIEGVMNTLFICGVIMALAGISVMVPGVRTRILGSAYDPNDLAMLMVAVIPIAIVLGLLAMSRLWKLACFGGSMIFILVLIGTQSRGGFVGLIISTIAFLLTKTPYFPKRKLLLLFGVMAMIFGIYAGVEYKERLATILEDVSDPRAGSKRVLIWQRALFIAKDNPVFGVGPAAFETAYGEYLSNDRFTGKLAAREGAWGSKGWRAIHNSFLQVLTELGIPGFLVFLAIIIRSFRNLIRAQGLAYEKSNTHLMLQAIGLKISFIGFLTCAFFLTHGYSKFIYIVLFLSGEIARSAMEENEISYSKARSSSSSHEE